MGENVLGYVAGISEKQEDSSAREFGRKKKGAPALELLKFLWYFWLFPDFLLTYQYRIRVSLQERPEINQEAIFQNRQVW